MWSPADTSSNSTFAAMPHFCNSQMSMTMYMDGFRSSLFAYLFQTSTPPPPTGGGGGTDNMDAMDDNYAVLPCLNFFLKRWTLDSPAKFIGAMVFVAILGIAAEGMAAARSGGGVPRLAHKLAQRCCCSSNSFGGGGRSSTNRRRQFSKCQRFFVKMCIISTHMVQALVGYILMLAAMSYSLELLGSVLLGLGLGYATFFDLDHNLLLEDGNGGRYEEVGQEEEEDASDAGNDTSTATGGAVDLVGAGTPSCCDVAGRGPPRRAFQFLRSPVPTLAGIGMSNRRISPREGSGSAGNDGDIDEADAAMAVHGGSHGDGADNLSLHEDDKMTPLL